MRYVYDTTGLKRYRFPTHVNDLVVDRSECAASEVFVVVLEPGEAPPLHKHDDTEQVYYVLDGEGILTAGREETAVPVMAGQVVVIPPGEPHSIRAVGGPVRYLAVDSFVTPEGKLEATWDEHVRAVCAQQGWDYDQVAGG
jgi:mannose-6-phosphate isomerase-like protein (cupin superfamily)